MMANAAVPRLGDLLATDPSSNIEANAAVAVLPKIASVQYLRAIAALSVALYHTLNIVQYLENRQLPYFYILSSGVDLFFCISGYIIWTTNWVKPMPAGQFVWNRLTRVVPLYWFFTLLAAVVAPFSNYASKSVSVHAIIFSLLMVPYTSWNMWPILGVGWTLNYEMFFYAVFATAVVFVSRKYLFITISTFIVSMVFVGQCVEFSQPAMRVYTGNMLTEFVFGMIIGKISLSGYLPRTRVLGVVFIVIGAATLLIASPAYEQSLKFRLSVWGLPCAMILLGTLTFSAATKDASPFRLGVLLGDSSYACYLIHAFIIMGTATIIKRLLPHNTIGYTIYAIVTLLTVAVFGILTRKYIELPLLNVFRNRSVMSRIS